MYTALYSSHAAVKILILIRNYVIILCMKRNGKNAILVCVAILLLSMIFTSCSGKYEYVPVMNKVEIYNSANEDSTWMDSSRYSTEHADYYFEATLKDKQKDSFVNTAEQVLKDYPINKAKFVVGTSFNTAYVGEVRNAKNTIHLYIDTFYFNIKDLSSVNILVELNAKRYGEKTPYGLLYALSYGQGDTKQYKLPKLLSDNELKRVANSNLDVTDLNTFVFLSSLSTDREKLAAQTFSAKLYQKIGLEKLLDIVENNDKPTQKSIINFYIKMICYELNIVTQLQAGITGYECYHTQKYIVAESADLNLRFFIAKDYKPAVGETHIKGYSDLKECFILSTQSFVQVNEFVGNDVALSADFLCYNDAPNLTWCNTHVVELLLFDAVVHEYTHIAMAEKYYPNNVSWTVEGIAEYCGYEFGRGTLNEWGLNAHIKNKADVPNADEVLELLLKFPPINAFDYCDARAYVTEKNEPNLIMRDDGVERLSYSVAGSLSNYLINTYGKEKYLELCSSGKSESAIYGKTFNELRAEWFSSLQERFEKI